LRPSVEWVLGFVAPRIEHNTGSVGAAFFAKSIVLPSLILLGPTIAIGAVFPLMVAVVCRDRLQVGRLVGGLYGINTVGGVAGSLVGGLFILPAFGTQTGILFCALAYAVGSIAAAVQSPRSRALTGAAAAAAVMIAAFPRLLPEHYFLTVATRTMTGSLEYFREDPHGTVAVLSEPSPVGQNFRRIVVDGVSNSADSVPSQRYMRLQTHLPILLHGGKVERVLVICFGTGITYGATFAHPDLSMRRCVELSPAVLAAAPLFSAANGGVRDREDADIEVADGRLFLERDSTQYDVITLEPPPPVAQGVTNLYSTDFYALCRRRLRPGGLMAQWLPLPTQNQPETQMLMRSFQEVFPYTTLWTTELHEALLIGSLERLRVDYDHIRDRMQASALRESLAAIGIGDVDQLLATFLLDSDAVRRFAADAPLITDDRPRIEYGGFQKSEEFARQLRGLIAAKSPVASLDGLAQIYPAIIARIEAQREELLTFYLGGIPTDLQGLTASREAIARVVQADPNNAYYRWLLGGGARP